MTHYDADPLTTEQLELLISTKLRHGFNKYFKGIFPIDIFAKHVYLLHPPFSFVIVNIAPSTSAGLHWIVLTNANNGFVDVYDAVGRFPYQDGLEYSWIFMFAELGLRPNIVNTALQTPNTNVCGHMCLHYLCARLIRGISHESYLREHSADPATLVIEAIQYAGH